MAEWFKALVLKTSEVQASVSSNLTASANPLKMTPKMRFGPLVVHSGKKMAISSYSDGWENNLRNRGWQLFARNAVNPSLKALIECLDYRSVRISKLDLKAAQNARPNSLSSRYDLEKFPPHTDFVLEKIPATYTILWASSVSVIAHGCPLLLNGYSSNKGTHNWIVTQEI